MMGVDSWKLDPCILSTYQSIELFVYSGRVMNPYDALKNLVVKPGSILEIGDKDHHDVCDESYCRSYLRVISIATFIHFSSESEMLI